MRIGIVVGGAVVVAAACGPTAAPVTPIVAHATVPVAAPVPTAQPCREAAVGLERATRDVRAPDTSILEAVHARCRDDVWPSAAVACFATMQPDDLAKCAGELPDAARIALFEQLVNGSNDPRATLEVVTIRLAGLTVGVADCDRFVGAVAGLMRCDAMSLDDRVELGSLTLDAWSLPNHGLPASAEAKMTAACDTAMQQLQQRAATTGCPPSPSPSP